MADESSNASRHRTGQRQRHATERAILHRAGVRGIEVAARPEPPIPCALAETRPMLLVSEDVALGNALCLAAAGNALTAVRTLAFREEEAGQVRPAAILLESALQEFRQQTKAMCRYEMRGSRVASLSIMTCPSASHFVPAVFLERIADLGRKAPLAPA